LDFLGCVADWSSWGSSSTWRAFSFVFF